MPHKVLYLGAEFNADPTRFNDDPLPSMDSLVQDFLRTGSNTGIAAVPSSIGFYQILAAQLRALGLLDGDNNWRAWVKFDDVSRVPAGGAHSGRPIYRNNVAGSVVYHRDLLDSFRPDMVVIGGSEAFAEYRRQVLVDHTGHQPKTVLQVRNPSRQAHRCISAWLRHYETVSLDNLAEAGRSRLAEPGASPVFLKAITRCTKASRTPWRVVPA